MKNISRKIGYAILFISMLLILDNFKVLEVSFTGIFYILFAIGSLGIFYNYFGTGRKWWVFGSTFLFLLFIYLFVRNSIELDFANRVFYFVFFAIPGISLITVFFEDLKGFAALTGGIILLIIALLPNFGLFTPPFNLINYISDVFTIIPVLLLIWGIILLIKSSKRKSPQEYTEITEEKEDN